MPAAAHDYEYNNSQSKNCVASPGHVIIKLSISINFVASSIESVDTGCKEEDLDQNNAQPDDKTTNYSDHKEI